MTIRVSAYRAPRTPSPSAVEKDQVRTPHPADPRVRGGCDGKGRGEDVWDGVKVCIHLASAMWLWCVSGAQEYTHTPYAARYIRHL